MNAGDNARQWQRSAKQRQWWIALLIFLPLIIATGFLSQRFLPTPWTIIVVAAFILAWAWFYRHSSRALDAAWLTRQLDQRLPNLEDSSDLLFKNTAGLFTLQNLQRERIEQRLRDLKNVDLRKAWPTRIIALSLLVAAALVCFAIFWPTASIIVEQPTPGNSPPIKSAEAPARLVDRQIAIHAPAYTGLPTRNENSLQLKFPEGATLNWKLKFQPQPKSASIVFYDGTKLPLQFRNGSWQAGRVLAQSTLYRLQANDENLADDKLYRLDAIKDLPPQIRVLQPDKNLSLVELGQTDWSLSFEAEDDYGLGAAQLRIQLAQGSGENIKFREQSAGMTGQGSRTRKRFSRQLDLTSLGVGPGDDVIVQFIIADQRSPQTNTTRSSSFILRWPAEQAIEATGVEGLVQKAIPAYFRSQRQIIIDTEKLLSEKSRLSADEFTTRSDTIGVDQRILRLRYGQFLGEEAEGGRDESASPSAKEGIQGHDEHEAEPPKKAVTPADQNLAIAAEYGHVHDIAEAATLLDPQTKKLLRAALGEMWQAELNLRQGQPKKALPFEYRALAFIKKVQQADRIYLARVGNDLPPIDPSRRLSGDRNGLGNRSDMLQTVNAEDAALFKFWQSLNQLEVSSGAGKIQSPDFGALRNWIREHPSRSSDSLGLLVAVDSLEKQPGCKPCLLELKAQLWPMLSRPPANPMLRKIPDRKGNQYLDALQKERRP